MTLVHGFRRSAWLWMLGSTLLGSALVACGDTTPRVEYKLTLVLPTPVTPGESATAYGVFPKEVTVTLGDASVTAVVVKNGLRFTVPANFTARDAVLKVTGQAPWGEAVSLVGALTVKPRVDTVTLTGSSLRVAGAGWAGSSDVRLKINGSNMTFTQEGEALVTVIPPQSAYGLLTVTVEVGKQTSNAKGVMLEAGAVQGRVVLPGLSPTPMVAAARAQGLMVASAAKAFLVLGNASVDRAQNFETAEIKTIRGLDATRFAFQTHELARQAFDGLVQKGVRLEWDVPIGITDAGSVVEALPRARLMDSGLPTPSADQWFLTAQNMPTAWEFTQGEGVTVAVVDTGVDLEHPDLKANLLPGYDFVDDDAEPMDIAGHGTHVAGLVAANGKALGVAPKAKILPVRVLRDLSGGSTSTVAEGILWSAGLLTDKPNPNPAQIINLSLGSNDYSTLLENVIEQVQAHGVLVVAAAGNSGGAVSYPAAFNQVVSVTALAGVSGGDLTYQPFYASRGQGLWLTAFGGDTSQDQNRDGVPDGIFSTDLTDTGYGLRMGTSMAAPQVAGLSALALANGTPKHLVRDLIAKNSTDLGVKGFDLQFGWGLISSCAITGTPQRLYAVALGENNKVVSWSLVQADAEYLIGNLEPGKNLNLLVASDENANGIVGESGEWVSALQSVLSEGGKVSSAEPILLNPSDGHNSLALNGIR
jgi:serine protease